MQLGKAFGFIFDDNKWVSKLLLGGLISIVPILNFAWPGYTNEIIRRVARGDPDPLPTWDDLGTKFMQGLLFVIATFIYTLPIIIVSSLTSIPAALGSAVGGDTGEVLNTLGAGASVGVSCLIGIYGILLSLLLPAAQINYVRKNTFASLFELGTIYKIATADVGSYLIAWLGYFLISILVGVVIAIAFVPLMLLLCLGWVLLLVLFMVANPFIQCVYGHLFGQYAALQEAKTAQ
jgi:hypothetical protein